MRKKPTLFDDARVLERIRELLAPAPAGYGLVCLGIDDVLMDYLRGEFNADEAIRQLNRLAAEYNAARRRQKTKGRECK